MTIVQLIEQRKGTIHSCHAAMLVSEAARILAEKRIGAMPVMDGKRVIGIFSERDLLYGIAREGSSLLERAVGEVMAAPAITIGPETDLMEALGLMTRRRIRHLPVVKDDEMIGLVSIGDLVKIRVELAEAEAAAMREYIQTA